MAKDTTGPVDADAQNNEETPSLDTAVNPAPETPIVTDAEFGAFLRDVVVDEIKLIRESIPKRGPGNVAEQDRLIMWVTLGASHLAGK